MNSVIKRDTIDSFKKHSQTPIFTFIYELVLTDVKKGPFQEIIVYSLFH